MSLPIMDRVCLDIKWKGDLLCIKIVETVQEEPSHSCFRINSNCVCIENLEALFIQGTLWNVYGSQQFRIFVHLKGINHKTRKMVRTNQELWPYNKLSSR